MYQECVAEGEGVGDVVGQQDDQATAAETTDEEARTPG